MVTKEELIQLLKEGYGQGYNYHKTLETANKPERVSAQVIPIAVMKLKAQHGNTGYIYVGFDSELSSNNGMELDATEPLIIPIDRADKVWVLADTANDVVQVLCLV